MSSNDLGVYLATEDKINNKKVFAEGGGGGGGGRLKIQDKFGEEGSENFYCS